MTLKEFACDLTQEMAESIGFRCPESNIVIDSIIENFTTRNNNIRIPKAETKKYQSGQDDIKYGYDIAHEFEHLVQNFVKSSNFIPLNGTPSALEVKTYEKRLREFFNNNNISVTAGDYIKFANYVSKNQTLSLSMPNLMFDDVYYVADDDLKDDRIAQFISQKTQDYRKNLKDKSILYAGNILEVDANIFALKTMYEKSKDDPSKLEMLANRSFQYYRVLTAQPIIKTKEMFEAQIDIKEAKIKAMKKSVLSRFIQSEDIKEAEKRMNEMENKYHLTAYGNHGGFSRYNQELESKRSEMQKVFTNILKELCKQYDNGITKITFIDYFDQGNLDPTQCEEINFSNSNMKSILDSLKDGFARKKPDIVIDMRNLNIFKYLQSRQPDKDGPLRTPTLAKNDKNDIDR